MAVIGARPATGPWFLGRRGRPKPRTRPESQRRVRRSGGSRRVGSRVDVRPLLVVIAVAAALALFYLSQSARVAATGYEIDALQAQLAERVAERQQLVLEISQARSPTEITRRARAELKLVPLADGVVTFAPTTDEPAD